MAIYPFLQESFVDKSLTNRQQVLETISKLRSGDSFQAFKEKFVMDKKVEVDDEDLKKLYISYNFMDSVIKKLVSYCPNLNKVKTRNNKKRKLIKDALNEIDWKSILNENYDTLESSADTFLEIYFENQYDKIPKLRVLETKGMIRAIMNSYNKYEQYVYKEWVEDSRVIYKNGSVISNPRERIIVFERGRKVIYDPIYKNNKPVLDSEKKQMYNTEVIENINLYRFLT